MLLPEVNSETVSSVVLPHQRTGAGTFVFPVKPLLIHNPKFRFKNAANPLIAIQNPREHRIAEPQIREVVSIVLPQVFDVSVRTAVCPGAGSFRLDVQTFADCDAGPRSLTCRNPFGL
jgi:hypothetical protein